MKMIRPQFGVLLVMGLTAFQLQAQEDTKGGTIPPVPSPIPLPARPLPARPLLLNFKIEATTVAKFLDKLSSLVETNGEKLNLIQTPDFIVQANITRAPAMDLRGVTVVDVMNALNTSLVNEPTTGGKWERLHFTWSDRLPSEKTIWTGILDKGLDPRTSCAFYVGNLLGKFKIQDITTAIESMWNLNPKGFKPEMKYHEETQLLMILAERQQVAQAENILQELSKGLPKVPVLPKAASGN